MTDMANFLARTCSSGEVVMSSGKISVIIAAMTRCRVLSGPFGKSLMGKTELTRRENDNKSFWEAWGQSQLALKILRHYNVAYIVSDRSPGSNPPRIPVGQRTFQLVYENPDLAVYKVNLTG